MAVTVDEVAGSPTFSYSDGRYEIKRTVVIAWTDIDTYAEELVPQATSTETFGGALYPLNSAFRVFAFDVKPLHGDSDKTTTASSGINVYDNAIVNITYRVPRAAQDQSEADQDGDPVPFLTHNFDSGGQFVTRTPGAGLRWKADKKKTSANVSAGQFIPTTSHTVSWPRVVSPNWKALEQHKGKVNNAPFSFRGYVYPRETLLYLGYSGQQEVMSGGSKAWSFTLKFQARLIDDEKAYRNVGTDASPVFTNIVGNNEASVSAGGFIVAGWNHFWRSTFPAEKATTGYGPQRKPGWYRMADIDSTTPIYKTANFTELFQKGPP